MNGLSWARSLPSVAAVIERALVRLLIELGHDIDVMIKPKPRGRTRGRMRVLNVRPA